MTERKNQFVQQTIYTNDAALPETQRGKSGCDPVL